MQTNVGRKKSAEEEIAALPEDQKVVLSLYYEEQLSFPEISQVIGIPAAEVRRLYIRAATKVFS